MIAAHVSTTLLRQSALGLRTLCGPIPIRDCMRWCWQLEVFGLQSPILAPNRNDNVTRLVAARLVLPSASV